jgi:hypothetical protein
LPIFSSVQEMIARRQALRTFAFLSALFEFNLFGSIPPQLAV